MSKIKAILLNSAVAFTVVSAPSLATAYSVDEKIVEFDFTGNGYESEMNDNLPDVDDLMGGIQTGSQAKEGLNQWWYVARKSDASVKSDNTQNGWRWGLYRQS